MRISIGIFGAFVFYGAAFSQTTESVCSVVWGQAQVEESASHCKIDIKDSSQSHLIRLKVFEKNIEAKEMIHLQMNLDSVNALEGAEFRLYNETAKEDYLSYRIPIFADENFNWLLPQQANEVTFSPSQLEGKKTQGVKYTTLGLFVRLKAGTKNSINVRDIQRRVKSSFGQGLVSITFDDGFSSLQLADKILKKYKLNSTAYIIREAVGQNGYVNMDQLCQFSQGVWDIGSHSTAPFVEVPDLKKWIQEDSAWMKTQCQGRFSWQHLAYPLGKINGKVLETVRPFYKSGRIAGSGVETLPPADKWKLRAVNVTPSLSPKDIEALAKKSVENGDWLILMFHHIVDTTPKNDLEYSSERFDQLAKKLGRYRKNVVKMSQAPL